MADRIYVHGIGLKATIAASEYTDNTNVAFSDQLSKIVIQNWTDVKALDKIAISAAATANEYTEE